MPIILILILLRINSLALPSHAGASSEYYISRTNSIYLPSVAERTYELSWEIGGPFQGDSESFAFPQVRVSDSDGFYILDAGNNRLMHFDSDGKFIASFGRAGQGDNEFFLPSAITVGNNGKIYTGEVIDGKLKVFDKALHHLETLPFVTFGNSIAVDGLGRIYGATNDDLGLLTRYDEKGIAKDHLGFQFTRRGSDGRNWSYQYGFTVDRDNNLHIAYFGGDTCIIDKYVSGQRGVSRTRLCIRQIAIDSSSAHKSMNFTSGRDGYLYLLIYPLNLLYRLDTEDLVIQKITFSMPGYNTLPIFTSVSIGQDGSIYLVDNTYCRLFKFSSHKN